LRQGAAWLSRVIVLPDVRRRNALDADEKAPWRASEHQMNEPWAALRLQWAE
jgi:hypothetical protein